MAVTLKNAEEYEELLRKREREILVDLARHQADASRCEIELAVVRKNIADFAGLRESVSRIAGRSGARGATEPPQPENAVAKNEISARNGVFAGLNLGEAAAEYLKLNNEPKSVSKIWKALETEGFEITSGHPTRALGEALAKRAVRHNDVFAVGRGCWAHTANFTPSQVSRLKKKHAGMGGRSPDIHSAKTVSGMRDAMARGVKVGAPPKMTAEIVAEFKRLRASGKTVIKSCKAVGISYTTMWKNRAEIAAWTDGDPWPPKSNVGTEPQLGLRIVK